MTARRPTSPPSASSSRNASIISQNINPHAPMNPSSLREAHTIASSLEDTRNLNFEDGAPSSSEPSPNFPPTKFDTDTGADLTGKDVDETTALLKKPFEFISTPHSGPCLHGTFSPRLESRADSIRSDGYGDGRSDYASGGGTGERSQSMLGSFLETMNGSAGRKKRKKKSTTSYLAEQHGITNTTTMYVPERNLLPLQLC
jgi:hypothetical protein